MIRSHDAINKWSGIFYQLSSENWTHIYSKLLMLITDAWHSQTSVLSFWLETRLTPSLQCSASFIALSYSPLPGGRYTKGLKNLIKLGGKGAYKKITPCMFKLNVLSSGHSWPSSNKQSSRQVKSFSLQAGLTTCHFFQASIYRIIGQKHTM